MVHSTGHKSRLDRFSKQKESSFGSKDYSIEELVAEIGSAFMANIIGIDTEKIFENSVSYIQGWLKKLKDDNKFILKASSDAKKATDYIIGEEVE